MAGNLPFHVEEGVAAPVELIDQTGQIVANLLDVLLQGARSVLGRRLREGRLSVLALVAHTSRSLTHLTSSFKASRLRGKGPRTRRRQQQEDCSGERGYGRNSESPRDPSFLVKHQIAAQAGGGLGVRSLIGHIGLARTFLDQALVAGVGIRIGGLNVYTLTANSQTLFTQLGISPDAGVVWMPKGTDFRVAASGGLPLRTAPIQFNCDPNNCAGYILPSNAVVPWDATLGAAWRLGPTPWNDKVAGDYRDERQLTVAFELSLMGAVDNGYGMEAFAAKQLQVSGRTVSVTPRLGLETEAIEGWLRVRAGSYLEASRFPETSARLHGTTGAQVRVFSFRLAGHERRVAVSGAADIATRYKNLSVSVGFWN